MASNKEAIFLPTATPRACRLAASWGSNGGEGDITEAREYLLCSWALDPSAAVESLLVQS